MAQYVILQTNYVRAFVHTREMGSIIPMRFSFPFHPHVTFPFSTCHCHCTNHSPKLSLFTMGVVPSFSHRSEFHRRSSPPSLSFLFPPAASVRDRKRRWLARRTSASVPQTHASALYYQFRVTPPAGWCWHFDSHLLHTCFTLDSHLAKRVQICPFPKLVLAYKALPITLQKLSKFRQKIHACDFLVFSWTAHSLASSN